MHKRLGMARSAGELIVPDSGTSGLEWRAGLTREPVFLGATALLFIASVGVTIYRCRSMSGGMAMPGGWTMSMAWMRMPGQTRLGAAASFMGMWVVMMVAMMMPSLAPMLLSYRGHVRGWGTTHLGGLSALAAAGYFFVWAMFGAVAYPLAIALTVAEMRWSAFARLVPAATGIVLLLVGCVQLTRWKAHQLERCWESPRRGRPLCLVLHSAWQHGIRLGVHCSLCCAGFMTILLVIGVMDLVTMALVAAAITIERLAPRPEGAARVAGLMVIAAGALVFARAIGVA